jgi:hypothetical protein
MAAKLRKMLTGQLAAIINMLIINIHDMHMLAADQVAIGSAMGVPQEILKHIRQILWAAAKQSHRISIPTMQMTRLQSWIWPG